jgi:predicted NBD/HSP70 family sugar kinase
MSLIGIDAGGSFIKASLFDERLEVRDSLKVPSDAHLGVTAYYDRIAEAVRELTRTPQNAIIGLSAPGAFSKDRQTILSSPNIKGMSEGKNTIRFADELNKRLGVTQVVGENDAGCAALAEWMKGEAQGNKAMSLLLLTWGTGIGSALIADGQNIYGWEAGHLPIAWEIPSPDACGCGSHIDLEARIAVPRLLKLSQLEPIDLVDQAEAGQEPAQSIIDEALRWMARGLHAMAVVGYPDKIVVGGGMMDRDWLLIRLRQHIIQETQGYLATTLKAEMVSRASLGNNAGMIGAAVLAQQKFGVGGIV